MYRGHRVGYYRVSKTDRQKPIRFAIARPKGFEPSIYPVTGDYVNRATPRPHLDTDSLLLFGKSYIFWANTDP